ncbi:MAG: CHAT domain-containing tetratricopeptide repeat protein, partial [Balneolaceae bacterium]|nr:CHAT domain-containing tetratricopeptide repeat protein [Balneolaceae bacterium]
FIYMNLSIYDKAHEYFSKSLELSLELNNAALLSLAYGNMARIQANLGNYDRALVAYKEGLDYVAQTGNPVKEAQILTNLGNLYFNLGDLKKSLEYYKESLDLVLRHDITIPSELSTKYKNIATRQRDLGMMEAARANYRKALELRKQSGNIRKLSLSYMDMARLELDAENYPAALRYAGMSGEIADSTQIVDLMVDNRNLLGEIKFQMDERSSALDHFREAYRYSRKLSENNRLHSLTNLARTMNEMGSDSALYYGDKVIRIIESSRHNAGEITGLKAGYFEQYSDFYVDLAGWYLRYRNYAAKAFELVEASKARALSDELAEAAQNLDEILPEEIRIQKKRKLDQIDRYMTQLDKTTDPAGRERTKKQLRKAELEYAAFMSQVRAEHPQYKQIRYPSPLDLEAAQSMCDDDTAILEYAFSTHSLVVFLITKHAVRSEIIENPPSAGGRDRITRSVELFRDAILAHSPIEDLRADGKELTETLIAPFEVELSAHPNLIIVPDGVLAYLPFEALPFGDRFLVEKYNVKYAPSLTTFTLLNKPATRFDMDLLAVAGVNPNGTGEAGSPPPESANRLIQKRNYPVLPATVTEVDSIASKFQRASIHKRGNISERSLKQLLRENYRYIHLATHGVIDEDHPGLSGLVLSGAGGSNPASREDGLLRSSEIYQLDINSDMVVLSACNTGLGKIVKGEGILGLQRSFFYAGVPTVAVSLWNVYDRSTAFLMNDFYAALLSNQASNPLGSAWSSVLRWVGWDRSTPYGASAPAMRQAKLKMLDHPLFRHPVYWAPFIVVGR